MLKITGLILSCLILNIQTQNFQYYPANQSPGSIVFPGITNAGGAQSTQANRDVLTQIYGELPRVNKVEIEKSNEISTSSTVEQAGGLHQAAVLRPSTPQPVAPAQPVGQNKNLYLVSNVGINLLKTISATKSGNVVLSPYSITTLLALLQQGARGQTQQELQKALGLSPAESAAAFSRFSTDFKNRNSRNILKTACNVYVGENFNINTDFKKIARNQFDSDVTPVSFARSDVAARVINNWVSSKTNEKIKNLIPADAIDSSTQLVLVNAVYFKGLWEVPFNPRASYEGDFNLGNGQTKTVQYMRMKRLINYGRDSATGAQVVVLPFEGNQYSMMVILPSKLEGMSRTLDTLTTERLLSYTIYEPEDTQLEIPKFTAKADTDLVAVLKNMGLARMFGPYAELDGLGSYGTSTVQISSALHSAVLSVDEYGATAAAATTFAAVALSYDEPAHFFKTDRPFIIVLWDQTTSLPIFMAKIEDPQH